MKNKEIHYYEKQKINQRLRYKTDPEYRQKCLEYQKRYRAIIKNKKKARKYGKKYRNENRDKCIEARQRWNDVNREYKSVKYREWYQKNKKKRLAYHALRKQKLRQATPKWVSETELQAIEQFYIQCPEGYHVDHIWPLKNELCCGLHILSNLRYLPATDNYKKRNKLPKDVAEKQGIRLPPDAVTY